MEFKKYQSFVDRTTKHRDGVYPVLGLAGETGEFVELVKKAWRKSETNWPENIDTTKVTSELGDILWYITRIASYLNISLEDIVSYNIGKLTERGRLDNKTTLDNREVW